MSNSTDALDVAIIAVDEYYYIPKFLKRVVEADDIHVSGITTVSPSLGTESLPRFALRLYRAFGPRVFLKHGLFYSKYLGLDQVNRLLDRGTAYSPETLAERNGIEHRHVSDVNAESYLQYVRQQSPDVLVSVAATQQFDAELLDIPSKGAINIHSSLLPEYRGVSPSFWSLLYDEERTGITVHYMDENLDTGDVIKQRELPIKNDTLHSLNTRVAQEGAKVLLSALRAIKQDEVDPTTIDPEDGEYYSMPDRSDVRAFVEKGLRFY